MWETVLWPIGGAFVRVIPGWLENVLEALKDGKLEGFEVVKLGTTLLRVGVLTFFTTVGLDLEMSTGTAVATGIDFLGTWADSIFRKKS